MSCSHSTDIKLKQLTSTYFIHKHLNELLKTDNAYYKNASIYPVLETINDKFCKVMFEPNEEHMQMTPQQVGRGSYILKKNEEFGDSSDEAVKSVTGMFAQLQLCHGNSAKLAGHMVKLSKTLQPAQFTYIMKHSSRLLAQLSIPPQLCSPAELKFDKICLTPAERKDMQQT